MSLAKGAFYYRTFIGQNYYSTLRPDPAPVKLMSRTLQSALDELDLLMFNQKFFYGPDGKFHGDLPYFVAVGQMVSVDGREVFRVLAGNQGLCDDDESPWFKVREAHAQRLTLRGAENWLADQVGVKEASKILTGDLTPKILSHVPVGRGICNWSYWGEQVTLGCNCECQTLAGREGTVELSWLFNVQCDAPEHVKAVLANKSSFNLDNGTLTVSVCTYEPMTVKVEKTA